MDVTVRYVSRQMIRDIKPNRSAVFYLPTKQACQSARMQVSHVKTMDDYNLSCHIDFKERRVVIIRGAK